MRVTDLYPITQCVYVLDLSHKYYQLSMESLAMNELCLADKEGSFRGRMGRGKTSYGDTVDFKSKNLHAERRRREKLSNRLLTLRALVPIITNVIT